ncbi:thiamine phosphate synthase [Demequina sp. B12]|uniref:thiamine phosphate synthase n=1 Tax=Demequina sp. B12 TaxID=2992757 RepID=UPI00237C45F0|nr:thiamine phosphate synthase [Demequina sp. B12]MDE0571901.1 thiamine phosphate synthase [Demequina sp. B12]
MSVDLSVYLVTDVEQSAGCGRDIVTTVRESVAGGVTAVQIRRKHAETRALLGLTRSIADALPEHVSLFINDRVDVALAARRLGIRVDGVHLGQQDMPLEIARRLLGEQAVIGVSTSTESQILAACSEGADYIGIGAVRETQSKEDPPPPLGIERACELARSSSVPAVAIGGVRADDMAGLRRGGFAGAAVVSWICAAPDPKAAASMLNRVWEAAA